MTPGIVIGPGIVISIVIAATLAGTLAWFITRSTLKSNHKRELHATLHQQEINFIQSSQAQAAEYRELEKQNIMLKAQLEASPQSPEQMKQLFENLANAVLEEKTRKFTQVNKDSVSALLTPIGKDIKDFRQKLESMHTEGVSKQTELKTTIDIMTAQNQQISQEANALTQALTRNRGAQGSWGEMQLEQVLQSSGLSEQQYKLQPSYKSEDDKNQRPDAVVYLPENKYLIIDAKTSLSALVRLKSTEDETERSEELKNHVDAMESRVKELSERNYENIPELSGAPEYVFMFVPSEEALQMTLQKKPDFIMSAQEKKVAVITPLTLTPALLIVSQLWRLAAQEENTRQIFGIASNIYDKTRLVAEAMEDVGKQIEKTGKSYEEAMKRLALGRGNLTSQVLKLETYGVSVKNPLPKKLVEKTNIDYMPPRLEESK